MHKPSNGQSVKHHQHLSAHACIHALTSSMRRAGNQHQHLHHHASPPKGGNAKQRSALKGIDRRRTPQPMMHGRGAGLHGLAPACSST